MCPPDAIGRAALEEAFSAIARDLVRAARDERGAVPAQPGLQDEARMIWSVIASHCGRARAITAAEIAARTGIGDARGTYVRAVISEALEFFPGIVAGTPGGFFVAVTPAEAEACIESLFSRLVAIARRMAVVRRKCAARSWLWESGHLTAHPGQEQLFPNERPPGCRPQG